MCTECSLPRPVCGERAGVRGEPLKQKARGVAGQGSKRAERARWLRRTLTERRKDRQREGKLCALGYRVICIWSKEVIENVDGVLQTLPSERKNSPSLRPSPRKQGEGDKRTVEAGFA